MEKSEKYGKHRKHSHAGKEAAAGVQTAAAAEQAPPPPPQQQVYEHVLSQEVPKPLPAEGPNDLQEVEVRLHTGTEDEGGATYFQDPTAPPPSSPPSANERSLTRAQALAKLRRGSPPNVLQNTAASSRYAAKLQEEEGEAAFVAPVDDTAKAYAYKPSSSNSTSDNGGASLPLQQSPEGGAAYGNATHYHAANGDGNHSDIGSDSEHGEGGESASAPDRTAGKERHSVVTLPSAQRSAPHQDRVPPQLATDPYASTITVYPPEEPNALPRMLRLQRTFESNMRQLYSFCATHVTEWPALAVEWIPDRKFDDPERDYSLQYVAVGTQSAKGAPNQVRVMEVAVPDDVGVEAMYGLYGDEDIGPSDPQNTDPSDDVDAGKLFKNVRGHFRCDQAITLDSTVLKIRAMPAETNIIAVTTGSGFIGVFNLVQDQSEDERGNTIPDAVLAGHQMGGFGLSWNVVKPGYIASGADDGYVNYWDIKHRITIDLNANGDDDGAAMSGAPDMMDRVCVPVQRFTGHRDIITDVCWHASQGHLLASASLDGDVRLWDIRTSSTTATAHGAHQGGATAAQFHPVGAFHLVTAGTGGELCFWDIRRLKDPLLELAYHGRSVTGVQWAPFAETVAASYGEDGRVVVWDLGKTSLPLEYSADALAPPEVSFVHIGHLGVVSDMSWCPGKKDDWLMASADSFNGLHVYKPKESVVRDYVPTEWR